MERESLTLSRSLAHSDVRVEDEVVLDHEQRAILQLRANESRLILSRAARGRAESSAHESANASLIEGGGLHDRGELGEADLPILVGVELVDHRLELII